MHRFAPDNCHVTADTLDAGCRISQITVGIGHEHEGKPLIEGHFLAGSIKRGLCLS